MFKYIVAIILTIWCASNTWMNFVALDGAKAAAGRQWQTHIVKPCLAMIGSDITDLGTCESFVMQPVGMIESADGTRYYDTYFPTFMTTEHLIDMANDYRVAMVKEAEKQRMIEEAERKVREINKKTGVGGTI